MTKRTPLQEYRAMVAKRDAAHNAADEEFESKRLDAIERSLNERDKIIQAETDPSLSREERQKIFRSLRAWPRIALGIYETELAIAKKERREKGPPEYGRLEPSEIAADAVGNVVGLKRDRIFKLVSKGKRHIEEIKRADRRQPTGEKITGEKIKVNITAAEFEKILNGCNAIQRKATD
jgi:hypothetical protein